MFCETVLPGKVFDSLFEILEMGFTPITLSANGSCTSARNDAGWVSEVTSCD